MTEQPPPPPSSPGPPPAAYASGYAGPPRNGMGTAALVLGILGLLSFWTLIGGIVLGLLGLIFGIVGRKRANRGEATNGGAALAGIITGGIALAVSVVILAVAGLFFVHHKTDIQKLRDCLHNAQTQSDRQQCEDDFQHAVEN